MAYTILTEDQRDKIRMSYITVNNIEFLIFMKQILKENKEIADRLKTGLWIVRRRNERFTLLWYRQRYGQKRSY